MGMLIAYFDDSGTHTNSDVVIWNGLFGNHYQWEYFDKLWAAKLQAPSPGKGPLKRFHMTNCYAGDGEFLGWSRTATDYLVHELVDIILQCGLYSNGAAISRRDWDDLVTGNLRTALGDAEGYSLRMAFVRALKWAREMGSNNLAFVFDGRKEREKEGKRLFELFEHFSKIESAAVAPISLEFPDSYRTRPPQGADLLAWHQYRYAIEYLKSGGKTEAANSKELQRLSKSGRVTVGIAMRSAMKEWSHSKLATRRRLRVRQN
jgi:hypothetical protein